MLECLFAHRQNEDFCLKKLKSVEIYRNNLFVQRRDSCKQLILCNLALDFDRLNVITSLSYQFFWCSFQQFLNSLKKG